MRRTHAEARVRRSHQSHGVEKLMAKKTGREAKNKPEVPTNEPWIPMRTGVVIITITSIVMTVLTAWQAIPAKGVVEGILWGLFYGGMIWAIFLGFLMFYRWIRK